jgi:hypothetical protein
VRVQGEGREGAKGVEMGKRGAIPSSPVNDELLVKRLHYGYGNSNTVFRQSAIFRMAVSESMPSR